MQSCDSTCSHCARSFWAWWKARNAQMGVPRKKKGETVAFNDAAATSVRPARKGEPCPCGGHEEGAAVTHPHRGEGTVVHDKKFVGLDGTHWVRVAFGTWTVHVPCGELA